MSINAGSKSIAEIVAEAEKQKAETAKREAQEYAKRRQAAAAQEANGAVGGKAASVATGKWSGGGAAGPKAAADSATTDTGKAAAPQPADDLRDEFDYALEAVEAAKKSVGRNAAAIETMAVNLLIAKAGVSKTDAPRFIRKAIKYLER